MSIAHALYVDGNSEVHGPDILVKQTDCRCVEAGRVKYCTRCLKVWKARSFHVIFFSRFQDFKCFMGMSKELGVHVLFLKSYDYGMSPSFLFEKCDNIVTNSKTTTDLPHPTYKEVIPVYDILAVVTMFCPLLKNDFSSSFPLHSSLVILSLEYYKLE